MAKYINLNSATDEDIVAYLLDYWHIDSFKFEGDFNPMMAMMIKGPITKFIETLAQNMGKL